MKIYRNHYSTGGGGSGGFSFHPSQLDAIRAAERDSATFAHDGTDVVPWEEPHEIATRLDIPTTKAGLIQWLNRNASHPDNG